MARSAGTGPTGTSRGCSLGAELFAKGTLQATGASGMEQQAREQAFISALTTEQFVLQAARSANVGEMTGRGTVYMGTVSSALIAFGNTLENLALLRQMQRIRGYYRTLVPEADQFFGPAAEAERPSAAMATVGLRAWPAGMLFTGASVIAAINSVVGGVGLALLAAKVASLATGAALAVGIIAAVVLFGLHLLYQQQRGASLVLRSPAQASSI
jgi:hypothetical protein